MTVSEDLGTSDFERELSTLRLTNRMTHHPFAQVLRKGEATRDQLKVHAVIWYFHTVAFPNVMANLIARCRIPSMRAGLSEGLYEEYTGNITGTKSHLELYLDYTRALGITPEFLESHSYMTPGIGSLVHWYYYCTTQLDPLVGIASLAVAAEGGNANLQGDPGFSRHIGQALSKHYGFTDEQIQFWTVHDAADEDHTTAGVKLVTRYAETDHQKEMVRSAIRHTQHCVWATFDDVLKYSWDDVTSNNSAMFY
jgi:pyrroloquinoline-quinone synthase